MKRGLVRIGTCWCLILLKMIRWVWDVTVWGNYTAFPLFNEPWIIFITLPRVLGNPLASYAKWLLFGFNWKVSFTGKKMCNYTDISSFKQLKTILICPKLLSHITTRCYFQTFLSLIKLIFPQKNIVWSSRHCVRCVLKRWFHWEDIKAIKGRSNIFLCF